jgi:hypothetical protein
MPAHDDKRQLRKLKRAVKRDGNKHRRHDLKRKLREHPEEAHHDEENVGRSSSQGLNGIDQADEGLGEGQ